MVQQLLPTFVALLSMSSVSSAAYILSDNYTPSNFFSKFNFFTGADPTGGYVTYVSQGTAQSAGLISSSSSNVYMGVDHTNVASGSGRNSVRLESKNTYTHGLFILDLNHMPGGICGVWPAFWTYGPNWPNNGEIDIIEGVNSQNVNFMTLHTSNGCTMSNGGFTGQQYTTQCAVGSDNTGCSIHDTRTNSYGTGFNNGNGGVYAMQWTSSAINIWFFPRGSIPSDISNGAPTPSGWGTPAAAFDGGSNCNIDSHFATHSITFDTTFCGSWAGAVWSSDSVCGPKASSCNAYVQNNPSAFQGAYWSINSLQVYQDNGAGGDKRDATAEPAAPSVAEAFTSRAESSDLNVHVGRSAKVPYLGLSPNDPGNGTFDQSKHTEFLVAGYKRHLDAGRHSVANKRGLLSDVFDPLTNIEA